MPIRNIPEASFVPQDVPPAVESTWRMSFGTGLWVCLNHCWLTVNTETKSLDCVPLAPWRRNVFHLPHLHLQFSMSDVLFLLAHSWLGYCDTCPGGMTSCHILTCYELFGVNSVPCFHNFLFLSGYFIALAPTLPPEVRRKDFNSSTIPV